MKVNSILPLRPLYDLIPERLTGTSMALLKATALELAILAGHLLLYPSGLIPERRAAPEIPPLRHSPDYLRTYAADHTNGTTVELRSLNGCSGSLPEHGKPEHGTPERGTAEHGSPERGTRDTVTAHLPAAESKPPVLLLHGFIDNRSVFVLLRRSLAQHGRHHVESLNYSPLTCDIRTAAALLGRHVEEICERTGQDRVDIVGHSLGGLIARYYVQCLGGDLRVRTLVSLGTPHKGTTIAPLMDAHPIVRQMRPGSTVIEELARPAPGCRTHFVSFWSDLDQIMVPLETARIDHPDLLAHNVRVTGVGHLALPVHPAVAAGIREALDIDAPEGREAHTPDSVGGLTVA
ncbi:alpha/beta fold hydrolase [Streptomyces sp. NPDC046821]|uniref:esterase/lipase family protein n=1 Tax=Streptomyces sp. NPDC046821 TaxID=3154702 RepID=UPI0033D58521